MSTARWFLADPDDWADDRIVLPADESHHALKVLRVSPPDVVTVTDGRGAVARCAVGHPEGEHLVVEILEMERRRRPRPEVVVYQGAAKSGKIDEVIEKVAEMDVAGVRVFSSERSVVKWDDKKSERLAERWHAIARSAAKQSRSPHVVETGPPLSWSGLLEAVAGESSTAVLWEDASLPLRTALVGPVDRIAIVVGPEGGFTRAEAEALADAGGQLVSLGPRILRTENAAVVTTAALLYHYGLIG